MRDDLLANLTGPTTAGLQPLSLECCAHLFLEGGFEEVTP